MKNHLTNIEIKNFKCFKDFKVKGLARVNLITGQNNVGKTSLMEACFLVGSAFSIFKEHDYKTNTGALMDRDWFHFEIIKLLIEIQQNRGKSTFILQWLTEELKLDFSDFDISINDKFKLTLQDSILIPEHFGTQAWGNWGSVNIDNFRRHKEYSKIWTKNHLPILNNRTFVSIYDDSKKINNLIGDLKLNGTIKQLNSALKEMFNIQELDVIKDSIMLKNNGKFMNLSQFGDGIRHFINIIIVLLSNKNQTIYIDEVDNGIHHSLFNELWQVILKTSKKLNIQVFATTHSKECLESYARIAKKLADKDIALVELGTSDGQLKNIVFNHTEIIEDILFQDEDMRGWE